MPFHRLFLLVLALSMGGCCHHGQTTGHDDAVLAAYTQGMIDGA